MLGNNLRNLREKNGYTLSHVAQKIGVSTATLSNYEIGTRKPDWETIVKFADFYNVSTDYLLGHTPKNSNPKIDTIAAHLASNEYTDEDLQDIKKFIEFVDSKKN